MSRKRTLSLFLAMLMLLALTLSGCCIGAEQEEELLTAEQRAALGQEGTNENVASADTGETSGEGFEDGATIGISLPWLGTQNWKEAETMFKEKLGVKALKLMCSRLISKLKLSSSRSKQWWILAQRLS